MLVLPDEHIVVGGGSYDTAGDEGSRFLVARLRPGRHPDTAFWDDGLAITHLGG